MEICLRDIAPTVSLYVNAHNAAARAAYLRAGVRADRDLRDDHVLSRVTA